jgi:hypothetical protein
VCSSCGHRQADDGALMAGQLPPRLAASAAGSGRVRRGGMQLTGWGLAGLGWAGGGAVLAVLGCSWLPVVVYSSLALSLGSLMRLLQLRQQLSTMTMLNLLISLGTLSNHAKAASAVGFCTAIIPHFQLVVHLLLAAVPAAVCGGSSSTRRACCCRRWRPRRLSLLAPAGV